MNNLTIGMDLGDKNHEVCVLNNDGLIKERRTVDNTKEALIAFFRKYKGASVAMEAGTHSPWISRELATLGCKVLVGNPRKLRVIWDSDDKADLRDAEMLGRIARFDERLLHPVNHRGKQAQVDLKILQARDSLVKSRTHLINHVRSSVKSIGERLPACGPEVFHKKV